MCPPHHTSFLGHNHYHQFSLDPLSDYVICVCSLSTDYTIVLLIAIVYIQCFFSPGLFLATASAYLCGCFGFFDLFGELWATSSSTSLTTSWTLDFYSFVGRPIWPGPDPLCLICLLDFAVFWTGILPEFFFLPFFIMLTTSLANILKAFGMAEFVFNFYSCFINALIAFW